MLAKLVRFPGKKRAQADYCPTCSANVETCSIRKAHCRRNAIAMEMARCPSPNFWQQQGRRRAGQGLNLGD